MAIRRTEDGVLIYSSRLLIHDDDYHTGSAILTEAKIDVVKSDIAKSVSGSYIGNASVNRAIPHGATKPKFVFLTDKETGGATKIILSDVYCMGILNAVSPNARGVTVADDTNFYVGNAANYTSSANANNHPYEWTAIL